MDQRHSKHNLNGCWKTGSIHLFSYNNLYETTYTLTNCPWVEFARIAPVDVSPENPTPLQPLLIRNDTQRPALHFPSDNFDDCFVWSSSKRATTHAVRPMSPSKSGGYEELGVRTGHTGCRCSSRRVCMMAGRGSYFWRLVFIGNNHDNVSPLVFFPGYFFSFGWCWCDSYFLFDLFYQFLYPQDWNCVIIKELDVVVGGSFLVIKCYCLDVIMLSVRYSSSYYI